LTRRMKQWTKLYDITVYTLKFL